MRNFIANTLGILCAVFIVSLAIMVAKNAPENPDVRTDAQRSADSEFIAEQLRNYKSPHKISQEQALYEVWNLTERDVAKPINLWGEKQ